MMPRLKKIALLLLVYKLGVPTNAVVDGDQTVQLNTFSDQALAQELISFPLIQRARSVFAEALHPIGQAALTSRPLAPRRLMSNSPSDETKMPSLRELKERPIVVNPELETWLLQKYDAFWIQHKSPLMVLYQSSNQPPVPAEILKAYKEITGLALDNSSILSVQEFLDLDTKLTDLEIARFTPPGEEATRFIERDSHQFPVGIGVVIQRVKRHFIDSDYTVCFVQPLKGTVYSRRSSQMAQIDFLKADEGEHDLLRWRTVSSGLDRFLASLTHELQAHPVPADAETSLKIAVHNDTQRLHQMHYLQILQRHFFINSAPSSWALVRLGAPLARHFQEIYNITLQTPEQFPSFLQGPANLIPLIDELVQSPSPALALFRLIARYEPASPDPADTAQARRGTLILLETLLKDEHLPVDQVTGIARPHRLKQMAARWREENAYSDYELAYLSDALSLDGLFGRMLDLVQTDREVPLEELERFKEEFLWDDPAYVAHLKTIMAHRPDFIFSEQRQAFIKVPTPATVFSHGDETEFSRQVEAVDHSLAHRSALWASLEFLRERIVYASTLLSPLDSAHPLHKLISNAKEVHNIGSRLHDQPWIEGVRQRYLFLSERIQIVVEELEKFIQEERFLERPKPGFDNRLDVDEWSRLERETVSPSLLEEPGVDPLLPPEGLDGHISSDWVEEWGFSKQLIEGYVPEEKDPLVPEPLPALEAPIQFAPPIDRASNSDAPLDTLEKSFLYLIRSLYHENAAVTNLAHFVRQHSLGTLSAAVDSFSQGDVSTLIRFILDYRFNNPKHFDRLPHVILNFWLAQGWIDVAQADGLANILFEDARLLATAALSGHSSRFWMDHLSFEQRRWLTLFAIWISIDPTTLDENILDATLAQWGSFDTFEREYPFNPENIRRVLNFHFANSQDTYDTSRNSLLRHLVDYGYLHQRDWEPVHALDDSLRFGNGLERVLAAAGLDYLPGPKVRYTPILKRLQTGLKDDEPLTIVFFYNAQQPIRSLIGWAYLRKTFRSFENVHVQLASLSDITELPQQWQMARDAAAKYEVTLPEKPPTDSVIAVSSLGTSQTDMFVTLNEEDKKMFWRLISSSIRGSIHQIISIQGLVSASYHPLEEEAANDVATFARLTNIAMMELLNRLDLGLHPAASEIKLPEPRQANRALLEKAS